MVLSKSTKCYEFLELAHTNTLPFSKAFELTVNNTDDKKLDLRAGLHQYVYNIRNNPIIRDFMVFGAWVYENSRQVIDTNTSDAVKIAYAKTCQPIEGENPASI